MLSVMCFPGLISQFLSTNHHVTLHLCCILLGGQAANYSLGKQTNGACHTASAHCKDVSIYCTGHLQDPDRSSEAVLLALNKGHISLGHLPELPARAPNDRPSHPDPLEPEDYLYFGEHAFPLACQWLIVQIEQYKAISKGTYGTNPVLDGIPTSYLIMLGMPSAYDIKLHG